VEFQKCGDLDIETWILGEMEIETWKHEDMEAWRNGDMQTCRYCRHGGNKRKQKTEA
jgi:hypothetical protein